MPYLVRNSSTRWQKIQPGWLKTTTDFAIGRFVPEPQGRQDLRPSTGEDALGVTLHHRLSQGQNPRDSPVGDAINAFRPSLRTVANPHYRKAGQMATDPPLRGADQIRELSHALLSVKEVLENPEPRQIA